ncbi:MAG TPA: class I SAM-dependent methyltransferase [Mycobacteriales bacterium]|nr:class I SAM-dependent methyltransferase [Mycobacteriales bacterium]
MTSTDELSTDNRALKAKHRAMWAMGDYPQVALDVIPDLGAGLVEAAGVRPGDRVLDVAAGSGNVAIPAALAGGRVVASDLTPEMFEAGRRLAAQRGAQVEWREADAEALPFEGGEFDVVLSCVGVMFAPHHQAAADELARVCRPGGTIGLVSWTPDGFVGQMLAAMRPYVAPPPPGAQPPTLWGDEEHVRALFGDGVTGVTARRQMVTVDRFHTPAEFREYFKAHYGPTAAAYRGLAETPERAAELDAALDELAAAHNRAATGLTMDWEYLLLTARKSDRRQGS